MIDYIKGKLAELTPTFIIVENEGIGYYIKRFPFNIFKA